MVKTLLSVSTETLLICCIFAFCPNRFFLTAGGLCEECLSLFIFYVASPDLFCLYSLHFSLKFDLKFLTVE